MNTPIEARHWIRSTDLEPAEGQRFLWADMTGDNPGAIFTCAPRKGGPYLWTTGNPLDNLPQYEPPRPPPAPWHSSNQPVPVAPTSYVTDNVVVVFNDDQVDVLMAAQTKWVGGPTIGVRAWAYLHDLIPPELLP